MSSQTADPRQSDALRLLARGGLVAYGLVHLLIAWLAVRLAFGDGGGAASKQGALQEVAQTPVGGPLLVALAVGLAALVVWQLAEAWAGKPDDDGASEVLWRAGTVAKAVVYAVLAGSAARTAMGDGSSGGGDSQEQATSSVLGMPGGDILVGLAGLVVIAVAARIAWRGWKRSFCKHLDSPSETVVRIAIVGHVAKGAALALIGVLLLSAAVEHDSDDSGGLDDALKTLLEQPYGSWLVAAIGLGFAAFAIYCFLRARSPRPS